MSWHRQMELHEEGGKEGEQAAFAFLQASPLAKHHPLGGATKKSGNKRSPWLISLLPLSLSLLAAEMISSNEEMNK